MGFLTRHSHMYRYILNTSMPLIFRIWYIRMGLSTIKSHRTTKYNSKMHHKDHLKDPLEDLNNRSWTFKVNKTPMQFVFGLSSQTFHIITKQKQSKQTS